MWTAIIGIITLSFILVLVGMLSSRSPRIRHAGTDTTTIAQPPKKSERQRGNNVSNPAATKLAARGAVQTSDTNQDSED